MPVHYEPVAAKQVLNKVQAQAMPFEWSLNTYRGCSHGCSFCYARETHGYLGLNVDDSFQSHIFIKDNAPSALEAQLRGAARRLGWDLDALRERIRVVAIGTATDPYQPIEAKRMLTRECLKILARYGIPVSITTRSPLVLRDIDILQQMRVESINISVHTLRKDIWKTYEPATPNPHRRLEAVRELAERGLNAGVFVAPIIPYLTDSLADLEEVLQAAKLHAARFTVPSILRLTPGVKAWFLRTLAEHEPNLLPRFLQLYRQAYPPTWYTGPLLRNIRERMDRLGLDDRIDPPGDLRAPAPPAQRFPEQLRLPL